MRNVFLGDEPTSRILTPVPDETHLAAYGSKFRRDGALCEVTVEPYSTYVFDKNSIAAALAGYVVVPADIAASTAYGSNPTTAPGRWLNQTALGGGEVPATWANLAQDSNLAATSSGNVLTANAPGALGNIDGVAPAVNMRVLLFGQTAGKDNGLWVITSLGSGGAAWTMMRAAELAESSQAIPGMGVYIVSGANYGAQKFTLTTPTPITLGTTALTFREASNIITLTLNIPLATLQAAGAVKTYNFNLGSAALPANARYRGGEVILTNPIDDAGHGTAVLNLGWSGSATALENAVDISAATGTGFPKALSGASAFAGASAAGGHQITGSIVTGANLNVLTAGNITITAQFSVGG